QRKAETMPKLTETLRTSVELAVHSSLTKMLDSDHAAEILAEFIDGRALLVFTRDQLRIVPVDEGGAPDAPDDWMPGNYL
ncbi:MAG: hypothetical protein JWR83_379, partial [Aeromicrobium sp.]|nr:hypothetical protein [Aeromicrobium sp.]